MSQKPSQSGSGADPLTWRRQSPVEIAEGWIRYYEGCFKEDKNPASVWDAIGECLSKDIPLPPWVREYLLKAAANISALSRRNVPKRNQIDRAVTAALGLSGGKGGYNPFRERFRLSHEDLIATQVFWAHRRNKHHSWRAIFQDVADAHGSRCDYQCGGISAGTVRRYWYKHAPELIPQIVPRHILERARSQKLDDILR